MIVRQKQSHQCEKREKKMLISKIKLNHDLENRDSVIKMWHIAGKNCRITSFDKLELTRLHQSSIFILYIPVILQHCRVCCVAAGIIYSHVCSSPSRIFVKLLWSFGYEDISPHCPHYICLSELCCGTSICHCRV